LIAKILLFYQARVSADYLSRDDQWKIGVSSMFAHALGLAPSKDTLWTSKTQNGNPKYPSMLNNWNASN
jgi:hypothetical protein